MTRSVFLLVVNFFSKISVRLNKGALSRLADLGGRAGVSINADLRRGGNGRSHEFLRIQFDDCAVVLFRFQDLVKVVAH